MGLVKHAGTMNRNLCRRAAGVMITRENFEKKDHCYSVNVFKVTIINGLFCHSIHMILNNNTRFIQLNNESIKILNELRSHDIARAKLSTRKSLTTARVCYFPRTIKLRQHFARSKLTPESISPVVG